MAVKRLVQLICLVSLALVALACDTVIESVPTHTPVPTDMPTVAPLSVSMPTATRTPTLTSTSTPTTTPTLTPTSTPTTTPTLTLTHTPTVTPTPLPADARLTFDLQLSNFSPLVGERVKATFKVRNYGEQTFTAAKFLVKGRGPDGSIQDFRPIDNFSLDPGAEATYSEYRSFSVLGEHWFTPHYSPDGANWLDITWPDDRVSYVYITVDSPPVVEGIYAKPSTIYQGAKFVIEMTASDDFGLQSIQWWGEGTGDDNLDKGGEADCDQKTRCELKWTLEWTGKKDKFTIYARARDTADQLSSVVSTAITVLPTEKFSLSIGGGPFNDASVQVAMGLAINWTALQEGIGKVVLVDFASKKTLAGPTEPAYDLDLAKRLLAQTDYSRFDTVLLYDSGDELSTELAEEVAKYLNAVNISTERRGVASANARTLFADMIAADESGLLIARR